MESNTAGRKRTGNVPRGETMDDAVCYDWTVATRLIVIRVWYCNRIKVKGIGTLILQLQKFNTGTAPVAE